MKLIQRWTSQPTQDGDGVKISRVSDFANLSFDPFLMFDELKSDDSADFIGGFPPHPHRGIETFTYMIKGGFEHRDQMGNKKIIAAGDVQWMSTGFGVIHSEMPVAASDGMHGFQIWVNMPAKDKLRPAQYQDSTTTALPEIMLENGITLKALAGEWEAEGYSARSPLNALAANAAIADVTLPPNTQFSFDRTEADKVLIYIHTGTISGFKAGQMLSVDPQKSIKLSTDDGGGALIFSGNAIKEQIAHMGPFVMNTQAELRQAVADYQSGKIGSLATV